MKQQMNTMVGGRYAILRQIGTGGFSAVFLARDVVRGKVYALKRYRTSDPANHKTLLEGMEKELHALKGCQHPVLPKIYNLIKDEDSFFLVMEYVEGVDLKTYVRTHGRMKQRQIFAVMMQVCSGLYYLHSMEPPFVYRDLKPSNILMQSDGRIKLIDFGIAKRYSREADADELALGSKGFAAPEQMGDARGRGLFNTDIRSDIYGVGATMYYLKTGKVYAEGCSMRWIPLGLRKIIRRCTMKHPKDRYQDCIALLCAMKSHCSVP